MAFSGAARLPHRIFLLTPRWLKEASWLRTYGQLAITHISEMEDGWDILICGKEFFFRIVPSQPACVFLYMWEHSEKWNSKSCKEMKARRCTWSSICDIYKPSVFPRTNNPLEKKTLFWLRTVNLCSPLKWPLRRLPHPLFVLYPTTAIVWYLARLFSATAM